MWYVGFLISAGFILLISFVLMSFPEELASTRFIDHEKKAKRKAQKKEVIFSNLKANKNFNCNKC